MLNKLFLNNFKCFRYNEVNFKPLTFLVGGNGVGKSSVIQSILLAKQSIDNIKLDEEVPSSFEVKLNGPYLLNLGLAKNILSSNATSQTINLSLLNDLNEETKINYSFDGKYGEHLLEGSFETLNNKRNIPFSENFSYINAERLGPRQALSMGPSFNLEVGFKGDHTSHSLFRADNINLQVHESLKIQQSLRFSRQVEAWMSLIFPDLQLDYKMIEEVNMVSMKYKNGALDTDFFAAPNNGFGISYTLPIIVAGLILSSKNNGVLVVENPEAHLHPLGQSRMGRFLAALSLSGVQVIIETHSEHVINGSRVDMAKSNRTEDLMVNFLAIEKDGVMVQELTINKFGELLDWPIGFFDQEQQDLKELFLIKREKKQ
ncbi:hypothetical protein AJ85_01940 [Alkalihalobacillus alcalophilus ATCC 27647 = CGMCC 1.3604]|uniref:ATPase n=1 Tax=Alkalihalobacillus alcalophilus ATCC 27647 = CGMCC 1.3604 TaxID=1218173 RepID=A0A094YVG5_ALKAL|nr:DUF3696 domain-containing protein [Alkalihalobacillus alcalophilus]KGA97507.1 hypothetical protein BALCAV_0209625 [Alkalihalobacillus alcalophilus ATCC 27647 = CGMCC 1.3604]MED1560759.1 DUF3696 domain-containing protein [Alkalihalobacillus alcalophilus]THG91771.1 hypothetical protein AJ85_01940 [Alkalihalobacillus alcalophilus ATCC 27647 = CGMCC 1.3604]